MTICGDYTYCGERSRDGLVALSGGRRVRDLLSGGLRSADRARDNLAAATDFLHGSIWLFDDFFRRALRI